MSVTRSATAADAPLAAVTGATGFIGQHLVPVLMHAGWRVRLLARREPRFALPPESIPEVVPGTLGDEAALEQLVSGAAAVVHAAGLIKAARRSHFFEVNCAGAARLARIARRIEPQAHFLLISTLAAREPSLSDYAASKRAAEDEVRNLLGERVTVLRPPVVYGPADRETLRFFELARAPVVPLLGPPSARAAFIHVEDLARLVVTLAATAPTGAVLAAADARPQGYGWTEILGMAARAVGNANPRLVRAPRLLLHAIARAGDAGRLLGIATMLNSQKLREISHLDWSVSAAEQARPAGWAPRFELERGFVDAVAWYRKAGWLAG